MSAGLRARRAAAYESPRQDVQALVPAAARRVLDLGCASGAMGAALKARGAVEVVGVESDREYAAQAAGRLDRVVQADIEELAAREGLAAELGRFDVLVAADVLEHLRDPWAALGAAAALLEPGGVAVISLPNVRHWETFWALGRRGVWPRRDTGIFDRAHLRWFTLADARELVEGAGLVVERVQPRFRLRPWETPWDRHLPRLARLPGHWLVVFQYLIVARRP
jgi:methionine biosynthesis protein MetW